MSTNGRSRRRNHGRGHSYYIDDVKVPGITTALGKGFPKPGLVNWAGDEAGRYVLNRWEELVELEPSERYDRVRNARFESSDEAKVNGTDVHTFAHRLAAGDEVEPPEHLIGHVDAYLKFVDDWQPAELMVEQPVFSRRYRYAGTPDLVAALADGRTWLLDWKTTAKGVFLDHVLQLAAARYAEYTVDPAGAEVPLPTIDAAGIVWLRADGYDLVPVEANEDAHRLFLYVLNLARFVDGDRDDWVGDSLLPPERAHA